MTGQGDKVEMLLMCQLDAFTVSKVMLRLCLQCVYTVCVHSVCTQRVYTECVTVCVHSVCTQCLQCVHTEYQGGGTLVDNAGQRFAMRKRQRRGREGYNGVRVC